MLEGRGRCSGGYVSILLLIITIYQVLEGVDGDAVAPVKFGGVYLPLEMQPAKCAKDPLLVKKNGKHKEPGKCVKDPLWGGPGPSPPIGHAPPRGGGELPPTK